MISRLTAATSDQTDTSIVEFDLFCAIKKQFAVKDVTRMAVSDSACQHASPLRAPLSGRRLGAARASDLAPVRSGSSCAAEGGRNGKKLTSLRGLERFWKWMSHYEEKGFRLQASAVKTRCLMPKTSTHHGFTLSEYRC
jgi:hypothetical protein